MDDALTVVIPVGPRPSHKRWLKEAIDSVRDQTRSVSQILIIDDMANLGAREFPSLVEDPHITVWKSPWRLGVAHAFNFGVALAQNELVFLLGSDDTLDPYCIEFCVRDYVKCKRPGDSLFFVGVKYSDGREDQFLPCGACMVTKSLWKRSGGFPIEAATGASDSALISIMMKNKDAGTYIGVQRTRTLYNYRVHSETDTAKLGSWQGVILKTRDLVTSQWQPPRWGEEEENGADV